MIVYNSIEEIQADLDHLLKNTIARIARLDHSAKKDHRSKPSSDQRCDVPEDAGMVFYITVV